MEIEYGELGKIVVSDEIGKVLCDLQREESNRDRKERYHRAGSLEAMKEKGWEPSVRMENLREIREMEEDDWVRGFLFTLTEPQRRRTVWAMRGWSNTRIARAEGVGEQRVSKSLAQVREKLIKLAEEGGEGDIEISYIMRRSKKGKEGKRAGKKE